MNTPAPSPFRWEVSEVCVFYCVQDFLLGLSSSHPGSSWLNDTPFVSPTPYWCFSFQISHLHLNLYLRLCLWGKLNQNTYFLGFCSWKNTYTCEMNGKARPEH